MTTTEHAGPSTRRSRAGDPDAVDAALARNRLGVPAVVFFVMSAAAPLTVTGGVIPTGFATSGVTGIPLAFVVIAAVLTVFAVGFVAMARHVSNTGAFYAYVSAGLGRPPGVAAAWVALLAYNILQVGLYGGMGAVASGVLTDLAGGSPPWWVIALVCWALVATLGLLRVDLNGRVLAFLLVAEVLVVLVYSVFFVSSPSEAGVSLATLDPGNLVTPEVGSVLALAALGFIGFESAVVFSEESKDPERTVPRATYASVAVIGFTYAFASWAMTVATGPEGIVPFAQEHTDQSLFVLAGMTMPSALASTAINVGLVLFVTSFLAAMISFHNTCARYTFALGREGVLPSLFGRTDARSGSPRNASLAQSAFGLTVILVYAVMGFDPLVQLFFWGGTSGALGVVSLLAVTSVAVLAYFLRDGHGENVVRRAVAPVVAIVALGTVLVLTLRYFHLLVGVPEDHPLRWGAALAYVVAAAFGVALALVLRARKPHVYARIGLGAHAAAADTGSGLGATLASDVSATQDEEVRP